MATIIYKKIFEVQILHDYFLGEVDTSFFSSSLSDTDREALLARKYNFDIANELIIMPTPACAQMMQNYKLRFIRTGLGFFVAQEVEKLVQPDGAIFYQPFIPLDPNDGLAFYLKTANGFWENYSGIPIKKNVPAVYYFDNKDENNDKVFPALSLPVPDFDNNTTYEMGMLAVNGGQLQEAIKQTDTNNPADWLDVEGDGFVNKADRLLLPRKFVFQLPANNIPVSITARLLDLSNNLVKSLDLFTKNSATVLLDFCNPPDDCVQEGWFMLEVIDNNTNTIFQKKVYLNDALFSPYYFGLIEIFQSAGSAFQLTDTDGLLIHRINADQTKVSHPVFEIRIRARRSYWRYKSREDFTPGEINAVTPILEPLPGNDKVLVAQAPESILAGINKPLEGGGNTLNLPNPSPGALVYGADGNLYSDIHISKINRFQ